MDRALYIAYLTGAAGSTTALFYIGDSIVAGVDAGGMTYDGTFSPTGDSGYALTLIYKVASGVILVTGQRSTEEHRLEFSFKLPESFWDGRVIPIDGPTGRLNARLEKLKALP
jgi:hypothetical protein